MKTEALNAELSLDLFETEPETNSRQPVGKPPQDRAKAAPNRLYRGKGLTLSSLLRGLGGLVIVAAFVLFLFQGWREGDDLTRYVLLIGHTLVLTLAGFAAGHLLHEGKGARLFIALALAVTPVSFAFLGGISYDHLTWDPVETAHTALGFWQPGAGAGSLAPDLVLLLTGAAVLLLGISIWIGFLVMARRSARGLSGLYLLANAAMLVPTRDSALIAVLLLALGLVLAILVVGLRRRDLSMATPEGLFARSVLALPLLVIGGRSIWLYAPGDLFFTTLALIGYVGLRQALSQVSEGSGWKAFVEWGAVGMAGISALFALATVSELHGLHDAFRLPIAGVVLAGLLVDLSTRSTTLATSLRSAAALIVAATLLANLFIFGGFANALVCVVGGVVTLGYGYTARQRLVFITGLTAALVGIAFAGSEAFANFTIGGWTGLVLLGVATVLAGSLIERYGEHLKVALGRWRHHFNETD